MKWIAFAFLLSSSWAAEYRVYKLRIVNDKTETSRIVHSTLDWLQYPEYHHLLRDERIELVDHWMCWKRSDNFKPLCKRPVTADTLKSENAEPEG